MSEFQADRVQAAVEAILEVLGNPTNSLHSEAIAAFKAGNHSRVKRLASTNLGDHYCRSLGYLGSALKLTPNTDTILAESARAAADHAREQALLKLGEAIATALEPELANV